MPVLKEATHGGVFQKEAKAYFINMLSSSQKLHKKGCKSCPHSNYSSKYYDFDTLEEAENSGIEYTHCRNCFLGGIKMKRYFLMLMAFVMCLSLVACGEKSMATDSVPNTSATGIDKNATDSYLGVWESIGTDMRFTINKGGFGRYEVPNMSGIGVFDFTYEVKDEVLSITIDAITSPFYASFELNDDGTALIMLHNGLPVFTGEINEFYKQSTE